MTGVQQAEAVVRQTWGQAASLGERKECRTGDRRGGRADSPMWKRGASARESADRAALSVWRALPAGQRAGRSKGRPNDCRQGAAERPYPPDKKTAGIP